MNLQDKIEKLRVFQKKSRKVQAETRQKLMNGAISIQEVEQFDQLITAVLHESHMRALREISTISCQSTRARINPSTACMWPDITHKG